MAESGVVAPGRWLEVVDSRPWGWSAAFLALAALTVAAMLTWWAIFGLWETLFEPAGLLGLSYDGRNHLTMAVLLAFVASGTLWVRQGVLRDIERLGALAGTSAAELEAARRRSRSSPRRLRIAAGAIAVVGSVALVPLTGGVAADAVAWDMHHVWAVANNAALFFLMVDSAWLAVRGWQTMHDYLHRHLPIDLLDRQTLASIGRIGMRGAVVWLVGGTIASSIAWGMPQAAPVFAILLVVLALATLSLLLPAQMARASLRAAKLAELERVRERIARAKEAALSGGGSAQEHAALLPGLLAYEARIESVPEWPYDTPTLVRFGVLALIAAGSWLGGALVERVLESVLD